MEHLELQGKILLLESDGRVDAAGVDLKIMTLFFRDGGDGTVGSRTQLQVTLNAIVLKKRRPQYLGKLAGGMAAKQVHLKEAILGGDKGLGEDEVIERCCSNVRYAVNIALDSDRS
jgi:hypothetical protein